MTRRRSPDPDARELAQEMLADWKRERDRVAADLGNLERTRVDIAAEVKRIESQLWRLREALEQGDPLASQAVLRELVERVELRFTHRPWGATRTRSEPDGGSVVVRELSDMGTLGRAIGRSSTRSSSRRGCSVARAGRASPIRHGRPTTSSHSVRTVGNARAGNRPGSLEVKRAAPSAATATISPSQCG